MIRRTARIDEVREERVGRRGSAMKPRRISRRSSASWRLSFVQWLCGAVGVASGKVAQGICVNPSQAKSGQTQPNPAKSGLPFHFEAHSISTRRLMSFPTLQHQ